MDFLIVLSALWSLFLLGVPRTALWMLGVLLFPEGKEVFSFSILSLFVFASLLAKTREGFFDLRGWQRDRYALLIFLVGASAGLPIIEHNFYRMLAGSLFILLFIQASRLIRFPLAQCWHFPLWIRYPLATSWLVFLVLERW